MTRNRITRNGELLGPGDPDAVDEVVHTGVCHFEMLDDHAAYLALHRDGDGESMLRILARPATRAERAAARRRDGTRLVDLPALYRSWFTPRSRWGRLRATWAFRRHEQTRVLLEVHVDSDGLGLLEHDEDGA